MLEDEEVLYDTKDLPQLSPQVFKSRNCNRNLPLGLQNGLAVNCKDSRPSGGSCMQSFSWLKNVEVLDLLSGPRNCVLA